METDAVSGTAALSEFINLTPHLWKGLFSERKEFAPHGSFLSE